MGIFSKIKDVFNSNDKNTEKENLLFSNLILEIKNSNQAYHLIDLKKIKSFNEIIKLPNEDLVKFVIYLIPKKYQASKPNRKDYEYQHLINEIFARIIKYKFELDDSDFEKLTEELFKNTMSNFSLFYYWPINQFLNKLSVLKNKQPVSEKLETTLLKIKEDTNKYNNSYHDKEKTKIISKIDDLLFASQNDENIIKPFIFLANDEFTIYANQYISKFKKEEKEIWFQVLDLAQKSTGGKPTAKFLKLSGELIAKVDTSIFKNTLIDFFDFVLKSKDELPTQQYYMGSFAISPPNVDILKGLVWMASHINDSSLIYKLSALSERCYKKIPNTGPASASLGNACIYSLYKSDGLEGIGQLSRLKLRIKQNNTQKLIENYLLQAAEEQGISIYEIEDLASDNFDLIDNSKTWNFEDYKAEVHITGIGKTETKWIKPDGNLQKTPPSFVKDKFAHDFKELKNSVKQIETNTTSQRDRIDRMFRSDRKMTWSHFNTYYLNHGLISFLAKKIIWNFTEKNTTITGILINNEWKNNANETITPSDNCIVSLWHPSTSSVSNISNWRNFLIENKIQQPLKQAFREVYILTDAEVKTKSYSNRMAAHILKQHQFNMLAKIRGWKYSLLGCFDDGRENGIAEINLKEHDLKAEFWINEVNSDDAYNDTGIWNYVATDQVRFVNTITNEVVDLIDVPVLVLSEILRDVDLFVGVASVGNDPTWQDTGGIPAYREYWQSYSFGDLTEIAKMRKDILTGLIPRLKINKIAEIKDKFLIIKGKLRTYKIHIGSTNILMEPNDEYLCIVQDRSIKNQTENIFLPFEGDNGLSIILSKAFLLADDDKITDSTITSQINRK